MENDKSLFLWLFAIAIALLLIGGGIYYWYFFIKSKEAVKPISTEEALKTLTETPTLEVGGASNPVDNKLPETNPIEKTNPFKPINPFK